MLKAFKEFTYHLVPIVHRAWESLTPHKPPKNN